MLFDLDVHYTYDQIVDVREPHKLDCVFMQKYFWGIEQILYGFIKHFDNRNFLCGAMQ